MPTYDYACPRCGGFDTLRALRERNEPAACPDCGAASPRVFANAPGLALMEGEIRRAMAVNERAANEPKRSGEQARLRHPAGCGCCTSGQRGVTLVSANGNRVFPTRRPWMISH